MRISIIDELDNHYPACEQCKKDMRDAKGGFFIPPNKGPRTLLFYVHICSQECLKLYWNSEKKETVQ